MKLAGIVSILFAAAVAKAIPASAGGEVDVTSSTLARRGASWTDENGNPVEATVTFPSCGIPVVWQSTDTVQVSWYVPDPYFSTAMIVENAT